MNSGTNNLANLARAGQLAAERTSPGEIGRLLKGADDQLRDSSTESLSAAGRFMLAYNATHALALAALRAEGYRPSTSQGHRKVIFQGVHQIMGTDVGGKWADEELRESKMVFIGKNLPIAINIYI